MPFSVGHGYFLAANLRKRGYRWKVDYDINSIHLRKELLDEIYHQYWYVTFTRSIDRRLGIKSVSVYRFIVPLVFSLFRGWMLP